MKKLVMLAAVAVVAACDSPTSDSRSPAVEFTFGVQRLQTEPAFLVVKGAGEVTIRGYYEAPCMPWEADATAEVEAGTLTLRVTGGIPADCWPVVQAVGYQAVVRDLPAGAYRVRVVHEWQGTGREPETLLLED